VNYREIGSNKGFVFWQDGMKHEALALFMKKLA
jgi:hypothetical protein